MGYDFWTGAAKEHSIQPDLTCTNPDLMRSAHVYFDDIDKERWVPRSVMVDLEPGVLDSI